MDRLPSDGKTYNKLIVPALAGLLVLGACGGGGLGPPTPETQPTLDYSNSATTHHSYAEYETGSYAYYITRGDAPTLHYIGGDLEPRETLRHTRTENGIRYFIGASRDGVGVDRLQSYKKDLTTQNGADPYSLDGHNFKPFTGAPQLYWDPDLWLDANEGVRAALRSSVRILNDALPPEFQITLKGSRATRLSTQHELYVSLETADTITTTCGEGAVACAAYTAYLLNRDRTHSAILYIPEDLDTSEYTFPRKLIIHELLHALGIKGHVDSVEFPDSIMGPSGEYIPNIGHVISKIDREILQIMYMNQETAIYNDWGEWSDTAFHIMGESEDGELRFGVALFNGLPQPWASGVKPDEDLDDNTDLMTGTVTWSGALLGFSSPSPIAGDAALEVDLTTVGTDGNEQDLSFEDIYFVNRFESDTTDDSDRWFHTRNIDYKVEISGNIFRNVKGDDYERGFITGLFMGAEHEHMGGTVKRTDMIGAFGGSRPESATISASERALGIASAIAPLAEGETTPLLRQITPAVERTAAGGVNVTVTADPVGPVYELLDSTPLDDVWSRAGLRGSEMGSREHITLYTNIEDPRRSFVSVYTLDEDNALTVDFAIHAMRVQSSGFPLPNFDREYVNAEELSFPGTFHGVAGTYECTTPPCTVSTANDGMISSTGGPWALTPDSDVAGEIMIDLPDTDHLYFGWWLKEPTEAEGSYAFRTFSGGTVPFAVGNKFTSGNTDGLLGTASYEGRAAGQYVTKDFSGGVLLSGGTAGVFTATATLTANFGGDDIALNDQFNIRGRVTAFRDVERNRALEGWSVTLNKVDLAPGSASFGGAAGDTTTATLGGVTGTGTWEGAFFGNPRADGKPGSVAGVFDAHLPAAHIAGGFGATNTAVDE